MSVELFSITKELSSYTHKPSCLVAPLQKTPNITPWGVQMCQNDIKLQTKSNVHIKKFSKSKKPSFSILQ